MRHFLILAALCLLAGPARADSAAGEAFIERIRGIEHLQGRFEQRQFDPAGSLLSRSSGKFRLLRPGYFAWEIQAPDSQLVIADPSHVWHHDRDLETVTRRPVEATGQASPLQVLGGDEDALREHFRIEQLDAQQFTLTPIGGDPGFQTLTVRMLGEVLTGMDILDPLNQRIEIDLLDVDSSTPLTAADFSFTPPEGADLFYYDE